MTLAELDTLQTDALSALAAAGDAAALEAWRVAWIGSKGRAKGLLAGIKDVPPADRAAYGARANALGKALEEAFASRAEALGARSAGAASGPMIDMTEPGAIFSAGVGRRHILSRVRADLVEVFARMGFAVAEGPELEDDEHNFIKLNIPPEHPAREPGDNFYIDDPAKTPTPRMLRSQTSTVQVRVMEDAVRRDGGSLRSPIRVISPGRVYRPDAVDATHSFMFHQIEGLAIDRRITMADLKATLTNFARAYFGPESQIRLRPSFFPFTEPSAELDMMIRLNPDQPARWIELGGCGMVHPRVLTHCGIDPEQWSGFAFGFGIERLAMGKHGIPDIRLLFENDVRFLRQI
ncbi:MAG: phenylalanine--tRNA ligase subunit alpha [Phycisphaerales bacterium]|jgi:phenylalanyl-tRNA synthetase alpha chain|nr:phenylalanine--tRNA ligase subunit alpha [Phycisphaeraceae bacterium]